MSDSDMDLAGLFDEESAEVGENQGGTLDVWMPNYETIVNGAIRLKLTIGFWKARKPMPWDDLGLGDMEEDVRKVLTVGTKKMLPPEYFKELYRIEDQARNYVQQRAFPIDLERGTYMVAVDTYSEEILPFLREKRAEMEALRGKIVSAWDTEIEQWIRSEFSKTARLAWRTQNRINIDDTANTPPHVYIDGYVRRVLNHRPSAQGFHDSIIFEWKPAYILTPVELEDNRFRAAEERIKREKAEAEARAEQELLAAETSAEKEIQLMRAQAERRRIAEDEALQAEIRNNALADLEREKASLTRMVSRQMRQTIYEVVVGALEAMHTTHPDGASMILRGKSVTPIREAVEKLTKQNFVSDPHITEAVNVFQAIADTKKDTERTGPDLEAKLRELAIAMRGDLIGLGARPRSARMLNVPDEVSAERVRRAREYVQLGPIPKQDMTERRVRRLHDGQPDAKIPQV